MPKHPLPPSPIGRKSSASLQPQTLNREDSPQRVATEMNYDDENAFNAVTEEKPAKAETSNPEKSFPNEKGARKRKARRPTRFVKPNLVQTEPINLEKLEVLMAAAARLCINEENSEEKSSEVNTKAVGYDNGMELLAAVATGLAMEGEVKDELGLGKKAP